MSANNDCAASLYVCRFRVARLNADGSPKVGANNMVVSEALARLSWEPELEAGTEHVQKNGCGDVYASYKKRDQVKRLTMTLDLVTPDPDLQEILVGGEVLDNGNGYAYPDLGDTNDDKVSIEAWSKALVNGEVDDTLPWIWWVFPETSWQYGARALEESFMGLPFTGSATENSNWDNGPANDWPEISTQVCQHLRIDDIPDADCGYQAIPAS
jgi:hypothetical protein